MLIKTETKMKCDVKDCKNDACYCFAVKGRGGKCFVCARCLTELMCDARKATVPKSPQNAIKRKMEQKSEATHE